VKQESVKHLADGATTLAVGSGASSYFGWFVFINENAPGVGVILSFFFGVTGLIFYILNLKKLSLADENKIGLDGLANEVQSLTVDFKEHKTESREAVKSINTGLDDILSRLPK
jgi:hypothetical protein